VDELYHVGAFEYARFDAASGLLAELDSFFDFKRLVAYEKALLQEWGKVPDTRVL
jgi:hypothetical protein